MQGHADVFVAEEMLHGLQVHVMHDQAGGTGVAELKEPEVCNPYLTTNRLEGLLQLIVGLALQIAKDIGRVQMPRQPLLLALMERSPIPCRI